MRQALRLLHQIAFISIATILGFGCAGVTDDSGEDSKKIENIDSVAEPLVETSGWYEVHFFNSGRCLDQAAFGTTAYSTAVQTWPCNGYPNQRWFFDSSQHVRGWGLNLCVYAPPNGNPTDTRVGPCNDATLNANNRMHFKIVSDNSGNRALMNTQYNYCASNYGGLDVSWAATSANPNDNCKDGSGVIPVQYRIYLNNPTGQGAIKTLGSRCLDVNGHGTADGTQVWLWDCWTTGTNSAQFWVYQPSTGHFINREYSGGGSGKCLTATGNANGSGMVIQTCSNSSYQKWTVDAASGQALIRNYASGRCLEDANYSTANGAATQLWDCNPYGGPVQHQDWSILVTDVP